MLTRFIRTQLIIFSIVSIVGLTVMALSYLQVPTLLGIGRITVKLELPAAGGLYRFANVAYRGTTIGKVTAVDLTDTGAVATMSLQSSPKVPADLAAAVRSVSAVGEQYVDLLPRSTARGYLTDGSVIPVSESSIPQPVGPMLDRLSGLVGSIPKDRLGSLLDETYRGLNGAGDDFETIVGATSTLARSLNGVGDQSRALVDDARPLLDAQVQSADATRTWARSLAGITGTVASNDGNLRHILDSGPGLVREVTQLLAEVKPTLPVLLANLATLGQVGVTYRPGLEQLLVLLPPSAAYYQASRTQNNPTGRVIGDFRVSVDDPPACTVGFLPPSQWRSPADETEVDTPDGLYCKLPQDSPIAVRGARNFPCMGHPGKRAPTVEICDSDKPYEPLAMRQHVTGPNPIDPNLISQGLPLDDRVPGEGGLYAPVQGTPRPADIGAPRPPAVIPEAETQSTPMPDGQPTNPLLPPALQPTAAPAPAPAPTAVDAPPGGDVPTAAPSAFSGHAEAKPAVAVTTYDPRTGTYLASDGRERRQANLVGPAVKRWQDLVLQS